MRDLSLRSHKCSANGEKNGQNSCSTRQSSEGETKKSLRKVSLILKGSMLRLGEFSTFLNETRSLIRILNQKKTKKNLAGPVVVQVVSGGTERIFYTVIQSIIETNSNTLDDRRVQTPCTVARPPGRRRRHSDSPEWLRFPSVIECVVFPSDGVTACADISPDITRAAFLHPSIPPRSFPQSHTSVRLCSSRISRSLLCDLPGGSNLSLHHPSRKCNLLFSFV